MRSMENNMGKALIAMSGGVDSSVAGGGGADAKRRLQLYRGDDEAA